jgi:hypothetical protein
LAEPSFADSRFFRVDYGDVAEVAAIVRTENWLRDETRSLLLALVGGLTWIRK